MHWSVTTAIRSSHAWNVPDCRTILSEAQVAESTTKKCVAQKPLCICKYNEYAVKHHTHSFLQREKCVAVTHILLKGLSETSLDWPQPVDSQLLNCPRLYTSSRVSFYFSQQHLSASRAGRAGRAFPREWTRTAGWRVSHTPPARIHHHTISARAHCIYCVYFLNKSVNCEFPTSTLERISREARSRRRSLRCVDTRLACVLPRKDPSFPQT